MNVDVVVMLGRLMLQEVLILVVPILAISVAVSLVVNIFQVLTSLQDQTISHVPRLLATGGAIFFLMPWMWRHLANYSLNVFSSFHSILR